VTFTPDAWGNTLIILVSIVIVNGILAMRAFAWMHRKVEGIQEAPKENKKEKKASLFESITYVLSPSI